MTMSKIIVIRPSTIKVLDRCSAVAWSPSSSVFSGVISFFGHDFEAIQEWICDVSATSPLQAIVPRVLLLEIMWCVVWAIGWHVLLCVRVYWLFWRYICFVNSWRSLLNWGAAACVVWVLELHFGMFTNFGSVDRFRDVSVWTTDIGHWELFISIAVYQLCLEGRFVRIFIRDGATFLRCYPWDGLIVTASSSVGLPEGKSSDCWSRWKLLVHACYILRSYGIQGHRDFWLPSRWLRLMDNMSCRIFRLLQSMRIYLWPLERSPHDTWETLAICLEQTTPVSQVLYRLAPTEMTKLKEHVEDSSDKGFIRPDTLPWGTSSLLL